MYRFYFQPISGAPQFPSPGGTGTGSEGCRRWHYLLGSGERRRHDAHALDRNDHRSAQGELKWELIELYMTDIISLSSSLDPVRE